MDFALEWRDRRVGSAQTPRQFLDYIVDGESLYEQHGADFIGPLGWLLVDADEEAARRLLRKEKLDVEGRVAVYVCPECADLLCGAITAVIERVGDEIVWRSLAMSSYDHLEGRRHHEATGFEAWGELRFPATGYYDAIVNRPRPAASP
jgi:hypothetical protein